MSKCPYPELMVDEVSGKLLDNHIYAIWHQGYEAHKLEIFKDITTKNEQLNKMTADMQFTIQQLELLKAELIKQKAKPGITEKRE